MTTYLIYNTDDYGRATYQEGAIQIDEDLTEHKIIQKFLFNRTPGHWENEADVLGTGFYTAKVVDATMLHEKLAYHDERVNFYKGLIDN